jgi:uncharacterized protein (TIGR02145 family)
MKKVNLILGVSMTITVMLSSCGGASNEVQTGKEGATSKEEIIIKLSENSKEVTIGKQIWMTENLNLNIFRNGDTIPQAKTNHKWQIAGENNQPAWCYYNNDSANGEKYGKLYNWFAVNDSCGLAPLGWHIPSDSEWLTLLSIIGGKDLPNNKITLQSGNNLGGKELAGNKMKSKSGWEKNGNGTNEIGFSAFPGGYRDYPGHFESLGYGCNWWSSTIYSLDFAWYIYLINDGGSALRYYMGLQAGFSVRC